MTHHPIGIFDSGVGGLTALRALEARLPEEQFVYFGDTARVPYGPRSPETILHFARQDTAFLRTFDLKAIVIACGTITTVALEPLRQEIDIPILGVVEPSCRSAVSASRNGRIGVAATAASIRSGAYEQTLRRLSPQAEVFSQACHTLASLVEEGHYALGDRQIESAVSGYMAPLKAAGIDTLILGCTHYPLLTEVFASVLGPEVTLVDAGAAVAAALETLLRERDLLSRERNGSTRLFVSGDTAAFERLASVFLRRDVTGQAQRIDIERY